MKIFFGIIAALLYIGGFFGCAVAKTSIQEIQMGIMFIIATLFFIGAAIIEAIHGLRPQAAARATTKKSDVSAINGSG